MVALLLIAAACGHDAREEKGGPLSSTSTSSLPLGPTGTGDSGLAPSTIVSEPTTLRSTTTARTPDTTSTPTTRPARPTRTYTDDELGVRLTVMTSSQDIGPSEDATFIYSIANITKGENFIYNSNADFIGLRSNAGSGSWVPSCLSRPDVVTYATLGPGKTIGGQEVHYPGDPSQHSCPRPEPDEYQLEVRIFGCRRSTAYQQGERDTCPNGRSTSVQIAVRQR